MLEQMEMQGRNNTSLLMFGVSEENGIIQAEAFICNRPLKRKKILKANGESYELLSTIELADFLFCWNVTTTQPFTLLRRKHGTRKRTT